ncbi:MAG: type II toxin-antitoxin system RelE/ParE family toxin [Verrucomicrobia bacterium]|nr:type II toxin-antitoxin system RelE/ParE family toxin [Verrucomicrobiota bacterium]
MLGPRRLGHSQNPSPQDPAQFSDTLLGLMLDIHPHHRMKALDTYRLRVGDYRVIYDFDRAQGVLHLLAVGHRREVYRK